MNCVQPRSAVETSPIRTARSDWRTLLLQPEAATLMLIILSSFAASYLSPYFADTRFILESATYSTEFGLVALVLTLIVIAGEIDLSVASMMALSACLFGVSFESGAPVPIAVAISLASGLVMGAINGVLVARLRLASIIVTIGTLILYRGLAQGLVGDRSIYGFPDAFVGIDFRTVFGVPAPVIVFVAATILLGALLSATVVGRRIYQIGVNELAARHVALRVERTKVTLFTASGLLSAVAGLMMASRLGSVRYDLAAGGEVQVLLIVMLGGTSIFGGRGTIWGTFLAFWLLVILATGLTVANVPINAQLTIFGVLLIISIIAMNALYARATSS